MSFDTTGKETADNFSKLGGAGEGFVKNDSDGNWLFGQSGSGYTFVETIDVLSDVTSVTFSGLDGNADRAYRIMYDTGPMAEAPLELFLRPNGLSTNQSSSRWELTRFNSTTSFFSTSAGMAFSKAFLTTPSVITDPSDLGTLRLNLESDSGLEFQLSDSSNYVSGEDFSVSESVTGQTSGATGVVVSWTPAAISSPGSLLRLSNVVGSFVDGEVVLGDTSTFAMTIAVASADNITSWTSVADQGTRFWIQNTAARMPAFIENGTPSGTEDSLDFDGADDVLENTAGWGGITSNRAFTMFFVVKLPPAGGSIDEIMFSYRGNFALASALTFSKEGGSNKIRLGRLDGGTEMNIVEGTPGGWTFGSWIVLSIRRFTAGRLDVYINGVFQGVISNVTNAYNTSGISFGDTAAGVNRPANFEMAAALTYPAEKSAEDIRGMEQFLGDKYGITIQPPLPPFASGFFDFYAEAGANRLMQGYDNAISQTEVAEGLRYNDVVAHWTDTTTNITSLTIESDVTNGIPSGSRFGLYKIDQTP